MVHLSANGEVIGQFDAKELPAVLAGGRIPPEAYFWREGMPEWRPLRELVLPPSRLQPAAVAKAKIEPIRRFPVAATKSSVESKLKLDPAVAREPNIRQPFSRRPEAAAVQEPAKEPATPPGKESAPRPSAGTSPAATDLGPTESAPLARPPAKRRGRGLVMAALLLLLLGAGGAAAWWLFLAEPPPLSGEVRVAGAEGEMIPAAGAAVFLVSQEELAGRWRRQSEEIQSRAAELDALLEAARATHLEKSLVLELAADVSKVADEYNMPDAAPLRAERDSAQAAEADALADVERLTREKDAAASPAAFLGAPSEAILQTVTDETGAFRLPLSGPAEGLAILVVAEPAADNSSPIRGWLAPLDPARDHAVPLRFSPDNALDAEQIEQMADAAM
ncbi:MAG: GYF domain-containing protein [Chthoniobacterales bacterium]